MSTCIYPQLHGEEKKTFQCPSCLGIGSFQSSQHNHPMLNIEVVIQTCSVCEGTGRIE